MELGEIEPSDIQDILDIRVATKGNHFGMQWLVYYTYPERQPIGSV
jgi:hypothetical protein